MLYITKKSAAAANRMRVAHSDLNCGLLKRSSDVVMTDNPPKPYQKCAICGHKKENKNGN
jgi:hypothetical protein